MSEYEKRARQMVRALEQEIDGLSDSDVGKRMFYAATAAMDAVLKRHAGPVEGEVLVQAYVALIQQLLSGVPEPDRSEFRSALHHCIDIELEGPLMMQAEKVSVQ